MLTGHLALLGLWVGYFALHSALAALGVKEWVQHRYPRCAPYYRLAYNALAVVLLIPPLLVSYTIDSVPLWQWHGAAGWLANGLALAALSAFFWSLRFYNTREFLGFEQLHNRQRSADSHGGFTVSPLHRYVRHPWYSLALVLIWTRDMNSASLVSTLAMTAYFVIGSRLEETKLLHYFGNVYGEYCARVPALLPSPWRHLDADTARRLERASTVNPN